jgi:hypothetical protein
MQALKEWAVVCNALEQGRQVVLLRKGGILEYRQGFEVKHEKFLMFPTFEHQSKDHLQPDYAGKLEVTSTPSGTTRMTCYAEAKDIRVTTDRALLKRLERFHIWNETYVNARMDYNPSKPMSVILVRVFRLDTPIEVQNLQEWAGCRSWVPLDMDISGASPVLGDAEFDKVSREFSEVLSIAA